MYNKHMYIYPNPLIDYKRITLTIYISLWAFLFCFFVFQFSEIKLFDFNAVMYQGIKDTLYM